MHICKCIQKGRPASAIITENNEQQATSEGWGQTNRNTIVSQSKEGKPHAKSFQTNGEPDRTHFKTNGKPVKNLTRAIGNPAKMF